MPRCRRLQTDHIDLYQSHDDDPDTPLRGHAGRLRRADQGRQGARDRRLELQRAAAGRGAGRRPSSTACRATRACSRSTTCTTAPCSRRSWSRCACERGVGVINFYALAAGFLTGKYRSEADAAKSARGASTTKKYLNAARPAHPRRRSTRRPRAHGATPGQVAIAWQIARPAITAPIASATSMEQLDELVGGGAVCSWRRRPSPRSTRRAPSRRRRAVGTLRHAIGGAGRRAGRSRAGRLRRFAVSEKNHVLCALHDRLPDLPGRPRSGAPRSPACRRSTSASAR